MTTTVKTYDHDIIETEMRAAGSHWWDRDSMRFFGTRLCGNVQQGPGGIYFATSEKPPHDRRKYSVRRYLPDLKKIETVGEFCGYASSRSAVNAARAAAQGAE